MSAVPVFELRSEDRLFPEFRPPRAWGCHVPRIWYEPAAGLGRSSRSLNSANEPRRCASDFTGGCPAAGRGLLPANASSSLRKSKPTARPRPS